MIGRLTLLCTLLLLASLAQARDGRERWRTIDTPRFAIHYPEDLEAIAWRTARLCEEASQVLTPILGYQPALRVQVVVTDDGDSANGSATAIPYPRLRVYAAPPELDGNLNDYDNWLRLLIFHEYVHILQLEQTAGLPHLLNSILGRTFAPNHALPSFLLEGGAVWLESATSARGRIRSALFTGFLRAQALADRLHPIDAVVHFPDDWPGANVWYLYGGHFMDWVAKTKGPPAIAALYADMSDELIPFGINRAMRSATGETLTTLYEAWRHQVTIEARALERQLMEEGLTPYRALTQTGGSHASPRLLPTGELIALQRAGRQPVGLYTYGPLDGTPTPPTPYRLMDGLDSFDVCPDGELVLSVVERHRAVYGFTDLYMLHGPDHPPVRLSRGARLKSPTCGKTALYAVQMLQGRTRLVSLSRHTGELKIVFDPGGLGQVGFPTLHPKGDDLAFTYVSEDGERDLIHLHLPTGTWIRLTHDDALELHPRFSPTGDRLVFSSDASGVYEIYALSWPTRALERLTRVTTGAVDPVLSKNGRLAFRMITADGYDLAAAEPAPLPPPPPSSERTRRAPPSMTPLPSREYSALATLWPVAISPAFGFTNAKDSLTRLGLDFETSDAADLHSLIGSLNATPEEDSLDGTLAYSLRRFPTTLSLSVSHTTRTLATGALVGSALVPFRQRVTTGGLSASLPFSRSGHSASASLRYGSAWSAAAENPTPIHDPLDRAPYLPPDDRTADLTLSVRYGNTESFDRAISTDDGQQAGLGVRIRHPQLGGELTTSELFFDYTQYVPVVLRHVLALKLNGAFGRGESGRRLFYALGAPPDTNPLLDALDRLSYGSTFLRGYPAGTERGDRYLLMSAEYRLPIADLFMGPLTTPFFARQLKLSLFTDWGQARSIPLGPEPGDFKKSVGAELVSEAIVGWRLLVSFRAGYAVGLDRDGEHQIYVFAGQWF